MIVDRLLEPCSKLRVERKLARLHFREGGLALFDV